MTMIIPLQNDKHQSSSGSIGTSSTRSRRNGTRSTTTTSKAVLYLIIIGMIGITICSFALFEVSIIHEKPTSILFNNDDSSSSSSSSRKQQEQQVLLTTRSGTRLDESNASLLTKRTNNNYQYQHRPADGEVWKKLNLTLFDQLLPNVIHVDGQDKEYEALIPIMKPTLGQHRTNVDAVFAFAMNYPIQQFCGFIESLLETGYKGDIVLAVSKLEELKKDVYKYINHLIKVRKEHVVIYAVDWNCYQKGNHSQPVLRPTAEADCQIIGMFGREEDETTTTMTTATGTTIKGNLLPVDDPRIPRPLATARFELYWLWSRYYITDASNDKEQEQKQQTFILLIDFRDTYFQRNPFENFDRKLVLDRLYFYQEHGRINDSSFNKRWLRMAYGQSVVNDMIQHDIICSGSTIGTQIAMERYLRAMIRQFDATLCRATGCDQGFHNYIAHKYSYSDSTTSSNQENDNEDHSNNNNYNNNIFDLILVKQGYGAINNLAILRTKPLVEWGIYDKQKTNNIYNWDQTTISNVIHQYDRDNDLKIYMRQRLRTLTNKYYHSISSS